MRPIRTIAVFPTLLTLGNLICGFFAIVVAARIEKPDSLLSGIDLIDTGNLMLSGWLIFLAMVFDALDGYVARLARTTSDFGAQLDSLCDVVSFGVAPGFLLVKMCPRFTLVHSQAVWIIAAAFAACAALRLARFNVETSDDDDHLSFQRPAQPGGRGGDRRLRHHVLHASPATRNRCWTRVDRRLPAKRAAVFRPVGGAVDGLADPLSARDQPVLRGQRSFGHVVAVVFFFVAIMVVPGLCRADCGLAFALYGPVRLAGKCGSAPANERSRGFSRLVVSG